MQHKAFDYIVKSETAFLRLQKAINNNFPLSENRKGIELVYGEDVMFNNLHP